jgi:DNA-binding PadR family transcriptional regulator
MPKLTKEQKNILSMFFKEGCQNPTTLLKQGIASKKTISEAFQKLVAYKIIETRFKEPTSVGRKKTYYGLTWKGLAYILTEKIVSPEKCYDIMVKNKMPFPIPEFDYSSLDTLPTQAQQNELVQTALSMWDRNKLVEILLLVPRKQPGIFFSRFRDRANSQTADYENIAFEIAWQMIMDDFMAAGKKYGLACDPVLERFFNPYKERLASGIIKTLLNIDPSFKKVLKKALNNNL